MELEDVRSAGGGLAALTAALVAAVLVTWLLRRNSRQQLPPGPWPLPLLGNLLELARGELPHRAMARLSSKYGPIVFLKLGAVPTILVSDATSARAFLSGPNDKTFASRPSMEITRRVSFGEGTGIAMAPYGDEWRHARKLCSLQLFTTKRVSEFESIRTGQIMSLLRAIEPQALAGQPVNLTQAIASLAEVTTAKMLLGKTLEEIGDAKLGMDLRTLFRRMIELFHVPIVGDYIPALGFLDRKKKATLDAIHAQLDTLISMVVYERQHRPSGSPKVIMDVLLESLDTNKVKNIIGDLIGAGFDTTSATLDWAMAELIENPEVMKRLQVELEQLTKGERRTIKEEELDRLMYLKAVIKETLRLHAPLPLLLPHMSTDECEVAGYRIPKGSTILVNVWAIGQDHRSWEEPKRFLPERFLDENNSLKDFYGKHFELLPFGSGRRICPGMALALPLLHGVLANLVHSFEWHLPPNQFVDLNEHFGVVVSRAHPLVVIPSLRS